jgi:exosortase A-associated hydrolase 2
VTSAGSGAARPEGRFFATDRGFRYALLHRGAAVAGAETANHLILLPPFAEEMNKSRRMFALLAQRLSRQGWHVWVPDLKGTGESEGDFGSASWEDWLEDVAFFRSEAQKSGATRVVLLGLRLGALLAAASASSPGAQVPDLVVLWQPVTTGEAFLTQFLRLKVAGAMRHAGGSGSSTSELRARLFAGEAIEVAGYMLAGSLARSIHELRLAAVAAAVPCPIRIFEVGSSSPPAVSPATSRAVTELQSRGRSVEAVALSGEPFWATVEIALCEPLLIATEKLLVS